MSLREDLVWFDSTVREILEVLELDDRDPEVRFNIAKGQCIYRAGLFHYAGYISISDLVDKGMSKTWTWEERVEELKRRLWVFSTELHEIVEELNRRENNSG